MKTSQNEVCNTEHRNVFYRVPGSRIFPLVEHKDVTSIVYLEKTQLALEMKCEDPNLDVEP